MEVVLYLWNVMVYFQSSFSLVLLTKIDITFPKGVDTAMNRNKKIKQIPDVEGERVELKIITPTEETVIPLKYCMVGGILSDGSNSAMGAYVGSMDTADATLTLSHTLRAFIKYLIENGFYGKPITMEQAKSILEFAVETAIETEKKNASLDNVSINEHIWKMKHDEKG